MNVRTVSIICPLFNEEKFIERCILSILEQDYPQDKLEVLLIDGRSTDHTADIVRRYTEKYPFIKLLDNPERVVPYALNKGLEAATGEVIMRIDGHCTYPTNYISELVRYLYELDADNVGGRVDTVADGFVGSAIAGMLSSRFGVGGSEFFDVVVSVVVQGQGHGEGDPVPAGGFPALRIIARRFRSRRI